MTWTAQTSVFTSPRQVRRVGGVTHVVLHLHHHHHHHVSVSPGPSGRDHWHQEDPQLISEVLFAVTSMLSFTRLAYILPAHESLGTLQISIGKMIDDMMRYENFSQSKSFILIL